jgi:hypothetical protein
LNKQRRRTKQHDGTTPSPTPKFGAARGSSQGMALATLGGVMLVLMISFANWREIDRIEESLDRRLGQIDNRMTEIAAKVDRPSAPAVQPARRGPDPGKAYPIKTAGSPAKGPAKAAVTIAEFSDFQ